MYFTIYCKKNFVKVLKKKVMHCRDRSIPTNMLMSTFCLIHLSFNYNYFFTF